MEDELLEGEEVKKINTNALLKSVIRLTEVGKVVTKEKALKNVLKGLSSELGSGGTLPAEQLEELITNYVIHLCPELAMLTPKKLEGMEARFRKLLRLSKRGAACGEKSGNNESSSQYGEGKIYMKIFKKTTKVYGFIKDATADIELTEAETENILLSFIHDLVNCLYFGNALANKYEWSGMESQFQKRLNLITPESPYGIIPTDFTYLDLIIDNKNTNGARHHMFAIGLSPELLSYYSKLYGVYIKENKVAGKAGGELEADAFTIDGGWKLHSYKGVAIFETFQTAPRPEKMDSYQIEVEGENDLVEKSVFYNKIGMTTGEAVATGGTIPANTYYFRVAPVTRDGEQLASARIPIVTTGNTSQITLSWGLTDLVSTEYPYQYKVYCSTTSGQEKLVKIIPGMEYDKDGSIVGDVTSVTLKTDPTVAGKEIPEHMKTDMPFVKGPNNELPPESIIGWDLDDTNGAGTIYYMNKDAKEARGLVTVERLSKDGDNERTMIKSYNGWAAKNVKACMWIRGVRRRAA